jgi:hypothetical protein
LAGKEYRHQAFQAAQDPAVKVRVAGEIVSRLSALHLFQAAQDVLGPLVNSVPADQKAILAAWQQQLTAYATADATAIQNRSATANQAYIKTLQARRAQAASMGDSAGASRYDGLISAAQAAH